MSAQVSWRHEAIPQALQQQRGSQLVPPDVPEPGKPERPAFAEPDTESEPAVLRRKPS
ncbi:MAG: hypothetical protein AB7U38_15030 [Hyphomicrobiales bacterium]